MIKLREFSPSDLDRILKIEKASFLNREVYSKSYFEALYRSYPKGFVIAETEKEIIGYAIGRQSNEIAEIISLAIDPNWREKGIGTKLIHFLVDHFKEKRIKKISLHVRTENEMAISFYQNLGFKILNTIENYYSNGTPAYLMEKEIMGN